MLMSSGLGGISCTRASRPFSATASACPIHNLSASSGQHVHFHSSTAASSARSNPSKSASRRLNNNNKSTGRSSQNQNHPQQATAKAVDDYHVTYRRKPSRPGMVAGVGNKRRSLSASGNDRKSLSGSGSSKVPAKSQAAMSSRLTDSGPWVPAPGKTTKGVKVYSSLDTTPERELRETQKLSLTTANTSANTAVISDTRAARNQLYDRRIGNLMTEVEELRSQMERERANSSCGDGGGRENVDMARMEEEEEEETTVTESTQQVKPTLALQSSLGRLAMTSSPPLHTTIPIGTATATAVSKAASREYDTSATTTPASTARTDSDHLLHSRRTLAANEVPLVKALFETELASETAGKAARHFLDLLERRGGGAVELGVTSQLIDGIGYLDEVCLELGRVVRDYQGRIGEEKKTTKTKERETEAGGGGEDALVKAARDLERINTRLRHQLDDKDRELDELRVRVSSQHDESLNFTTVQESLESTRAHLQKQLRQKEADCNRMAVQIRTLEGNLAQCRVDYSYMSNLVDQQRSRVDEEKEALKRATRAQRQRTQKAEQVVESLTRELVDKDAYLASIEGTVVPDREYGMTANPRNGSIQETKQSRELEYNNSHEIEDLKQENERLRQLAKGFEQRATKLDTEMVAMRESLAKAQEKANKDPAPKSADSKEDEDSKARHIEMLKEAESECRKAVSKQREMEDLCRAAESKLRETESRVRSLENENRDLSGQVTQLNIRLKESGDKQQTISQSGNQGVFQQPVIRHTVTTRDGNSGSNNLEGQVMQLRNELQRLKSDKESTNRRAESQLSELRNQLDQSESSSRSMQAYIHFLKKSYANVFAEAGAGGCSPPFDHRFDSNYA